jgi:hypothetical protein
MLIARTANVESVLDRLVSGARSRGRIGVEFDSKILMTSYAVLNEAYRNRLELLYRRTNLNLGKYDLGQFRHFYAALLAIASVQEHITVRWTWSGKYPYPIESAVVKGSRPWWIRTVGDLSGLSGDVCHSIIDDLTFRLHPRFLDLQLAPFVPLNEHDTDLAIAPPFVLASDSEENVLRICSWRRKATHDAISNLKEQEMRESLLSLSATGRKVRITRPHALAKTLPDIDLLVEHNEMKLVLICELKWARRPVSTFERIERNSELEHGIVQLSSLRDFIQQNPDSPALKRLLTADPKEYRLAYVLVTRDHLYWSDKWAGYSLIDYNIILTNARNR